MDMNERLQWFIDRIGKTVYRNDNGCSCEVCKRVFTDGVYISDNTHANYLFDCECSANGEGYFLKYFDTIEERDEFMLTQIKNEVLNR